MDEEPEERPNFLDRMLLGAIVLVIIATAVVAIALMWHVCSSTARHTREGTWAEDLEPSAYFMNAGGDQKVEVGLKK